MATPVELPKLGNTVEECIIAGWRKQKGDTVAAGEILADIETDKTAFELAAPVAGTLLATFFEQGALVPVFTNLCVIGKPGESIDAFRPAGAQSSSSARTQSAPPDANRPAPSTPAPAGQSETPKPARGGHDESPNNGGSGAALSPRASRYAKEHHLDPSGVKGSGPAGRILEADLRNAPAAAPSAPRVSSAQPATTAAGARVSAIREKIAARMRESLASTAQYTLNASAAAAGLLHLRAKIKAAGNGPNANINDLVAFCVIRALQDVPALNAEFINGKIYQHAEIHLGFACDTPRGLMVPVVRNAHQLSLGELAGTMKDLASRANDGKISADELSGATFTISNLGSLGIESFTPLLNPPQVAILGVGAIRVTPIRRQGNIIFIDALSLSLTCDHQVIDGAPGARFLQVLSEKIEQVEALCRI